MKSILVVFLLAVSQLAAAASHLNRAVSDGAVLKHRTNAARMAAGLNPLPPRELKARTWPGGNWPPTPPKPSNPRPSSTKPDCDDKKDVPIKCKRKGGGQIGYISKDWSKKGERGYGLCSSKNTALKLDFENSVTPFDFKISGGKDYPYLGFAGNNLNPGSTDSCVLTGTKKTTRGNGPSNVGNAYSSWSANSESQLWYYNRGSKQVESKWVNSGGKNVDSKVFYDPDDDLFHLVTDANAFKRKCRNAYEVEFELDD
ncbi:hypothetical protein H1R20_g4661, partial [Candolleomyces eurysporus]